MFFISMRILLFLGSNVASLQHRRNFLRILGEQTRMRYEREARVAREGMSAEKFRALPLARNSRFALA